MIASGVKTKSALMQTAQCVLTIALCLTRKVYADLKIGVLTMGKQHLSRDDRLIMKGKLQGTRENMDMVAMVLMDKCGWHVFEETADSRDTHSIAYLYECLEKLAEEINEGRIKRKHIKDVLKDECGVVFGD